MADTLPAKLADVLTAADKRAAVVKECATLVDDQVKAKSGFSGLAIKGAYGLVKAISAGIIPEAINHLLDGFVTELEPRYATYRAGDQQKPFSASLNADTSGVADALLRYTDDKAKVSKNATMKKAYEKLRPSAKEHVAAAVPALGTLLDKHLGRP